MIKFSFLFKPFLAAIACFAILALPSFSRAATSWDIRLSDADKDKLIAFIADKEFGGNWNNCIGWNKGEAFVSVGLGHYLWFSRGLKSPFQESFPSFIEFAYRKDQADNLGLRFPSILGMDVNGRIQPSPWESRSEFLRQKQSRETRELVAFLSEPAMRKMQLEFQVERLKSFADKMTSFSGFPGDAPLHSTPGQRAAFLQELFRFPNGIALLIHYPTFKGEGMKQSERYAYRGKNHGWGLFQVIDYAASLSDGNPKVKSYRIKYVAKTASIAKVRVAAEEILRDRANRDYTTLSVGRGTRDAYIKSWNRALTVYGRIIPQ